MTRPSDRLTRAGFLLWAAFLAYSLPEVFAGTGKGWPVRPDVYLLGIPLYGLHFLLLSHIAARSGRTGWRALYLLGLVFGLYETWITKVVWAGYPGNGGFAMGGIGAWFGLHETLGLLFFYHAVTSFLLPLAVISRLFPAWGAVFPAPDWLFAPTRAGRARRLGLVLIWASMGALNMGDPASYLFSWLPMLALLWLGWRWLERRGAMRPDSAAGRPALSRAGLIVAVLGLAAIYLVTYGWLRPEGLPPPAIQLLTLAFYPALAWLFWRRPRHAPRPQSAPTADSARAPWRWLLGLFATGLALTLIAPVLPPVATLAATIGFVALVPLGAGLFLWLVVWPLLPRRRAT